MSCQQIQANLFQGYLEELELALGALYQQGSALDATRLVRRAKHWASAWKGDFDVPKAALLQFGMLLGRVAEAHAGADIAAGVFRLLAERAVQNVGWIPEPAAILLSAGEFNRRGGHLQEAECYYNQAVNILKLELVKVERRTAVHKELGRLYYELAYLHRLRGNCGSEKSAYERSETECDLACDTVGAVIARAGLYQISLDEGNADAAVRGLTACATEFQRLAVAPEIDPGRRGFAQRWFFNVRFSLVQAHLATGSHAAARQLLDDVRSKALAILSTYTSKVIEAKICLAEDDLAGAERAVAESWTVIESQDGLEAAEQAAATVAISGLIHALGHSEESARSLLVQACGLRRDLNNSTAQGWAWAGRAILARDAGDREEYWSALHQGLSAVESCSTPVRAFLHEILRNSYATRLSPDLNDLKVLVCRSG